MRFQAALLLSLGVLCAPMQAMAQASSAAPITPSQLEVKAREACGASVTLSPDAILRADLDNDGREDVLFNWRNVDCQSSSALMSLGAGNCGMHNCGIDIYLSSQYRPGGWPKSILNHMEVPPSIVRGKLRTATQGGSCKFAQVCNWEWSWDGKKLVSRPLKTSEETAQQAASQPIAITIENLIGIWAQDGDKCATDFVLAFKKDGQYASYEENGDWRLLGERIAVVVRETYVLGDEGSNKPVANPKAVMMAVEMLTPDRLVLRFSDGSANAFRRCG